MERLDGVGLSTGGNVRSGGALTHREFNEIHQLALTVFLSGHGALVADALPCMLFQPKDVPPALIIGSNR